MHRRRRAGHAACSLQDNMTRYDDRAELERDTRPLPRLQAATPRLAARALGGLTLAALALLAVGCASIDGTVKWRSSSGGGWDMQPDNCLSGIPYAYNGVSFVSDATPGATVIYVDDLLHGPYVVVRDRDRGAREVFTPDRCSVLEGEIDHAGSVNRIPALGGSLRVACQAADGSTVVGSMTFRNCTK
jgi:hypothetical protein